MNKLLLLLVVGGALTWGAPRFMAAPPQTDAVGVEHGALKGTWGGRGLELVTDRDGAFLRSECGGGRIDQPIVVDAWGWFDVAGKEFFIDSDTSAERTVRYTGRVADGKLALYVWRLDSALTVGPMQLEWRRRPSVAPC